MNKLQKYMSEEVTPSAKDKEYFETNDLKNSIKRKKLKGALIGASVPVLTRTISGGLAGGLAGGLPGAIAGGTAGALTTSPAVAGIGAGIGYAVSGRKLKKMVNYCMASYPEGSQERLSCLRRANEKFNNSKKS